MSDITEKYLFIFETISLILYRFDRKHQTSRFNATVKMIHTLF